MADEIEKLEIGDHCPSCGGRIGVLNTQIKADARIRFLGCGRCGHRPEDNKRIIPLNFAPGRRNFIRRGNFRRR